MWIAHKTKAGDTLQSILKKYKIKDQNVILRYAKNKSVAPLLKKGQDLKAGTVIWVPDPNAKVYVIPTPKGQQVVDEKGYKEFLNNVHKTMDRLHQRVESNYSYAKGRHDAQRKINSDQWFVSTIVQAFSSKSEPTSQRKKADASFKKFSAAVTGRKYKDFEKLLPVAQKDVNVYRAAVTAWVDGLIGTAESSVDVLSGIREAGAFCGTAAAVMITAPVSLPATILVGSAASGGVGLAYDGFEQIGRVASGMKPMSEAEIGKRLLINAGSGALGAGIAAGVMRFVGQPLVKLILTNKVVTEQAARLSSKAISNRIFQSEIQSVANQLAKKGSSVSVEEYIKLLSHDRIMVTTLMKFFARVGSAGFVREIKQNKQVNAEIQGWIKGRPKELAAKDGKPVGAAAARALSKTGAVDQIYDNLLKQGESDLRKELRAELIKYAQQNIKQ